MIFVSKTMNFVSKTMNFVSKKMNFVSKKMNFVLRRGALVGACGRVGEHGRAGVLREPIDERGYDLFHWRALPPADLAQHTALHQLAGICRLLRVPADLPRLEQRATDRGSRCVSHRIDRL